MKTNIPCELIQDLFPSYIDGLTSEVTNQKIQEHVEECEPCKEMLCDMQQPEPAPILQKRKDEIDYLYETFLFLLWQPRFLYWEACLGRGRFL